MRKKIVNSILFSVMAALMLISVTPLEKLSKCLISLHVPSLFVMLLSMIYRYIYTMMDVASEVTHAYHLRNPLQKGIAMKDMGSVLGQMLVRGMDKGERVYESMKLRGYDGSYCFVDNFCMSECSYNCLSREDFVTHAAMAACGKTGCGASRCNGFIFCYGVTGCR